MPKKTIDSFDFSLVLACYNESGHIKDSIRKILYTLEDTRYSFEIIFIDDKSKDDTVKLIKELCKENKNKNFRAFFHKKNKGRGKTVAEGILTARSNVVGFIDIDLEVGPEYIPQFVRSIKANNMDLAIARRYEPFVFFPLKLFFRLLLSRSYNYLIKFLLRLPFEDTEAGYKFFNRKKILPILSQTKDEHWFWDTEIVARSYMNNLKITTIPTLFIKKPEKKSTVRIIPDIIAYFRAIRKFKSSIN